MMNVLFITNPKKSKLESSIYSGYSGWVIVNIKYGLTVVHDINKEKAIERYKNILSDGSYQKGLEPFIKKHTKPVEELEKYPDDYYY